MDNTVIRQYFVNSHNENVSTKCLGAATKKCVKQPSAAIDVQTASYRRPRHLTLPYVFTRSSVDVARRV